MLKLYLFALSGFIITYHVVRLAFILLLYSVYTVCLYPTLNKDKHKKQTAVY